MTQTRESAFNPSSPRSSSGGGADSNNQDSTPDTRVTTFSPGDSAQHNHRHFQAAFGTHSRTTANGTKPANDEFDTNDDNSSRVMYHQRQSNNLTAQDKDPFVTSKAEKQLSPTASSFRPLHVPVVAHGSTQPSVHQHHQQSTQSGQHRLAQGVANTITTAYPKGQFTFERGVSHYVRFIPCNSTSVTLPDIENHLQHLSINRQNQYEAVYAGPHVYVRFVNVHDAIVAHSGSREAVIEWTADFVSAQEFLQAYGAFKALLTKGARDPPVQSEPVPNGLVQIHVRADNDIARDEIKKTVLDLMESQGEILAFREISSSPELSLGALVEFADVNDALKAAQMFNGSAVSNGRIRLTVASLPATGPEVQALQTISPMRSATPAIQDMTNVFSHMGMTSQQVSMQSAHSLAHSPVPMHVLPPPHQAQQSQQISLYPPVFYQGTPNRYVIDQTPTRGQGIGGPQQPLTPMRGWPVPPPFYAQTPPVTPLGQYGGYQGEYASPRNMQMQPYGRQNFHHRHNAMRVARSPQHGGSGSGHNIVDVRRIQEGTDVRTTIMLRNIPNKVDQAMLKRIIDQSSQGKYDFLYLRIDFANNCNVGYAFINFVDPLDIIDFYNARANQKWNCFKSDKTAEISYATIQGKDCLVQKFRNSSVMLEDPRWRPKLFYTIRGPNPDMAGQEEPFPPPDNASKMKRSCENAEHVGLFTPNAGQHFRDEQRRRRSQFDRGTRLAALEEYGHDYENDGYANHHNGSFALPHHVNYASPLAGSYSYAQAAQHHSPYNSQGTHSIHGAYGTYGTPGPQSINGALVAQGHRGAHGTYDSDNNHDSQDPRETRNRSLYLTQDSQDSQSSQDPYYRQ
ncbi:putative meiosis protein [Podospora fimiseda]|uniref:Meiosis protein n=1 Tax=Podospora fimiseda TaxID=252190 RepID=A0AAN7BQY4_9PEZI|nr:putative meiosis protein [Podospora fimiseda]